MGLGYTAWVEQALRWVHQHQNDFRYPITTVNLSLGAQWNGSAPPSWATLESPLAQLVKDGIFVSVAAGNSFANFGVPGLAYPAASPYVVPVASVNAAGQLSDFSQRQQRVLATPGENITSTIPDFIFGADGNPNDWAAASGTSMAAPYLAGASVLVREAMTFVGYASITQSDIYQHLRNTADLVFDAVTTASYYRVNLARAIDTLIPADDYGSTMATACDLGFLSDSQHVSGQLTRLDDADVFQFTATANGVLAWNTTGSQPLDVTISSLAVATLSDKNAGSLRAEAGRTYTLVVSARNRLANYDLQLNLTPDKTVSVSGNAVRVQGTAGDDTIRFWVDSLFHLEVNGQTYAYPRSDPSRLSPGLGESGLGESWRFEIDGGGGNDRLTLSGSQGSDEVILRAGAAELRGGGYELSATRFATISVVAGEGRDDVARFFDTAGNDEFIASRDGALMRGTGYLNQVSGFDRVYATATTGADDVARFSDSPGSDEFLACLNSSVMRGDGYYNKAIGFDRVYAYSSGVGDDVARFYDSAGNDEFVAYDRSASMSGTGYYNKALNFARSYAYATQGQDVARLYDSAGNDLFVACADQSYLRGNGFYNKAIGFDRVYAYATPGQDDVARFYDTQDNDQFIGDRSSSVMRGSDYYNKAIQFRRVYAYAVAGGHDVAQLQGIRDADQLIAAANRQVLRGEGFYTDARGFACTYADFQDAAGSGQGNVQANTYWLASAFGPLPLVATSNQDGSHDDEVPRTFDLTRYSFRLAAERYFAKADQDIWQTSGSRASRSNFESARGARPRDESQLAPWRAEGPIAHASDHGSVDFNWNTTPHHNRLGFDHVAQAIWEGEIGETYLSALDLLFAYLDDL